MRSPAVNNFFHFYKFWFISFSSFQHTFHTHISNFKIFQKKKRYSTFFTYQVLPFWDSEIKETCLKKIFRQGWDGKKPSESAPGTPLAHRQHAILEEDLSEAEFDESRNDITLRNENIQQRKSRCRNYVSQLLIGVVEVLNFIPIGFFLEEYLKRYFFLWFLVFPFFQVVLCQKCHLRDIFGTQDH